MCMYGPLYVCVSAYNSLFNCTGWKNSVRNATIHVAYEFCFSEFLDKWLLTRPRYHPNVAGGGSSSTGDASPPADKCNVC